MLMFFNYRSMLQVAMSHDRPDAEDSTHDNIACAMAEEYIDRGYDVAVDADCDIQEMAELPEYDNYPSGCGEESTRVPDVYATQQGYADRNVEVETSSTVSDERTKCQLKTFDNEGQGAVVVPSSEESTIEDNLEDWNLKGSIEIWTY